MNHEEGKLTVRHGGVNEVCKVAHVCVDGRDARRATRSIGNNARKVRFAFGVCAGHRSAAVSKTRVGTSCAGAQLRLYDAE